MDGRLVQIFWKIDNRNRSEGASFGADAAAGTENFIDSRFFPLVIPRIDTVSAGPIDGAQFSAKVVPAFHGMAFLPIDDSDTFSHGFSFSLFSTSFFSVE